jgi:hypothetical protein
MNDITETDIPATADDGFVDIAERNDEQVIRGIVIKCVDGIWGDRDRARIEPGTKFVAWATAEAVQRWQNRLPIQSIVKKPGTPLPDIDELNSKIPQAQWEKGLNGPRPPWAKQHIVYLLDPIDGGEFTFVSGTVGAAIAVQRLRDKVKNMRMLRGAQVVPVITLGNKSMPTKFGIRLRPEFFVTGWRNIGAAAAPALTHEVGTKVEEPTLAEELDDEIPDFGQSQTS